MWFMNRIITPLVQLLLKSPLHGIMSSVILLLYYQGMKSENEYSLLVPHVRDFRRFPAAARVHELRTKPDGGYNESDIQKIARSILMVQVRLEGPISRYIT